MHSEVVSQCKQLKTDTMNFDEAQEIFDQIVEICYQIDSPRLHEVLEPIVREVALCDNPYDIAKHAEELQVNLHEIDFLKEEEEDVKEMHLLIEKLSE